MTQLIIFANAALSPSCQWPILALPSKVFKGAVITTDYGDLQVEITVANGKILDVEAIQAPGGSNQTYTDLAVPKLREETLTAQSANIQAVSGASGLSSGWKASLASAIATAGLQN